MLRRLATGQLSLAALYEWAASLPGDNRAFIEGELERRFGPKAPPELS